MTKVIRGVNLYGLCLGVGVETNKHEAIRYFKLSADQGNSDGQLCYDDCLYDDVDVEVDISD